MQHNILFVQGAGALAHKEDQLIVDDLSSRLGESYTIDYPAIKNEDEPGDQAWFDGLDSSLGKFDSSVKPIIVAHSLGAYLTLKYISTQRTDIALRGLFLIAPPYPSGDANWVFEGFELPDNFSEIFPSHVPVYFYHSEDDEMVPFAHAQLYLSLLPNAVFRRTTRGHQIGNDTSLIAEDIRKLAT